MIGHNWGAEHAERWIWIQASDLGGNRGDYLDIAAGRIKVGGHDDPVGRQRADRARRRGAPLGGFRGTYGTEVEESPTACEFTFPGKDINVKGRVSAPAQGLRRLDLRRPDGPRAQHAQLLDLRPRAEGRAAGQAHAHVEVAGAAAYELGTRDTDHGVPLQPYPDG